MEDGFLEEIELEDEIGSQLDEKEKYRKMAVGFGAGLIIVICCWISSVPIIIWLWENGDTLF